MVATARFIATNSQQNMSRHLLQATEPVNDRDEAAEYAHAAAPGEHDGTVPLPREDMAAAVARVLGLQPGQPPTEAEVAELVGGKRADGAPIGRRRMADYRRQDGKSFRGTDFVDVTLSTDISWGIARANAATSAGRALLDTVVRRAADATMAHVEHELGWTRRGAGGRIQVAGQIGWVRFVHQTARPAADGTVSPDLHLQHLIPNAVVLADGHVGALNLNRMRGRLHGFGQHFHQQLAERGRALGMNIRMRDGAAIVADVPPRVRAAFAKRSLEAEQNARAYAASRGLEWDALPIHRRNAMIRVGARKTQSGPRDGMADRDVWRAECQRLGFPPVDVVKPARGTPTMPAEGPSTASLLRKAAELRASTIETHQLARHMREDAERQGRPVPSIVRAARTVRAAAAFTKKAAELGALLYRAGESRKLRNQLAASGARAAVAYVRSGDLARHAGILRDAAGATLDMARAAGRQLRAHFDARRADRIVADRVLTSGTLETHRAAGPRPMVRGAAMPEAPRPSLRERAAATRDATVATRQRAEEVMPQSNLATKLRENRAAPAVHRRVQVSEADAAVQLREAMYRAGLRPREMPVLDGRLHYVPVEGDKGAAKSGAYRAYYDEKGSNAALWNYKQGGFVGTWKAEGEMRTLSPAEAARAIAAQREQAAAREASRIRQQEGAAKRANGIYFSAKPADASHPYLVAKGIGVPPGVRVNDKGQLVVPLRDAEGRIRNVQTIDADGTKKYLPGAQKTGVAFVVGRMGNEGPAILTEGLATAETVRQATGRGVIMALDSGNLKPVAEGFRAMHPDRPLIIAADNDHHLPARQGARQHVNEGVVKATAAAEAVGIARVWAPPALEARARQDKGTDWNDLAAAKGVQAVRNSYREAVGQGTRTGDDRWQDLRRKGDTLASRSVDTSVTQKLS